MMDDNENINDVNVNDEKKEVANVSNEVQSSQKKPLKKRNPTISVKKLPKVFRKSYSEKKLKSKLLKRIAIPQDKALIEKLFVKGGNEKKPEFFSIPSDMLFTKREVSKLKLLARETKRQGRIMLMPLIAVVCFIFIVSTVIGLFKNVIVKKAIIYGCETAFGAKTDVGFVDLRILDASLTVKDIAVGNKDSVMKNLFEVGDFNLKFNLTQALRGKLYAQNLEVTGVALNTDRTESCELPERVIDEETEKKKAQKNEEMKALIKERSELALTNLQNQAFDMLGGSDVETIVKNLESQLKTPDLAKSAITQTEDLVEKWKGKPDEVKQKVEAFSQSVKDLQNLDVASIKDVQTLQAALTKINDVINQSKELKSYAESLTKDVKSDSSSVQTLSKSVADAVIADKNLMKDKLETTVNALKNGKELLRNALDTVAYSMLGEYYPYVTTAVDYANRLKSNALVQEAAKKASESSAASSKKTSRERLKGTTFWYGSESPAVLIENAVVSSDFFSVNVKEITNDQNVRGKPMTMNGTLTLAGISNAVEAVLDARSASTEPLISLGYKGSGFKALIDGSKIASVCGVPSIDGLASIALKASADIDKFAASGMVDLNPVKLSTDGFASDIITKYYRQALESVETMDIGYLLDFSKLKGLDLSLDGDFADQFAAAIKGIVESLGNDAKEEAVKRLNKYINSSSNEYLSKAKEFLGIEGDVDVQNTKMSDIQSILEKKRNELELEIKNRANEKIQSKVEEMTGNSDAAKAATDAANKLFKKFGL
ncbi:MAG: TIGR03545 family protein [Treponema sp.]|nr:TIGR03545 family protein [Treponema sp.]